MPIQAETNLSALIESTEDYIWSVDLDFRLVTFNRKLQQDFKDNFGTYAAPGKRPEDLLPPEIARSWPPLYRRALSEGPFRIEYSFVNGAILELSLSSIIVDGETIGVSIFGKDITERKQAEELANLARKSLQGSEERYRTVFQTSIDAININRLSDGLFIDCNHAFLKMTGFEREEVIGKTSLELGIWADAGDRLKLTGLLERNSVFRDLEAQFRRKDGSLLWGQMSASVIELEGVPCILSVTRDISVVKAAEEQIRNLAFYDPLTNLPNRRLLLDRLNESPTNRARKRMRALLYVDVDDFKTLNDSVGHQTGDLFLLEMTRRITACVRESDSVARLGADDFVVFLDGLKSTRADAAAQAEAVAQKLLACFRKPFLLDGREFHKTSSVGVSVFSANPEFSIEALQQAEIAMYQAKSAGRNSVRFFSPCLQAAANARAALEQELRLAIKNQEFVLYFQPQVQGPHLIGFEALLRWNHPVRGLLAPVEFIPATEETGLIFPLGDWVLKTICSQLAAWAEKKEMADIPISININALQFRQTKFVEKLLAALDRAGANPRNLILELTESIFVDDTEDVIARMTILKSHGVRFSLDDFGTGYSSLSYLKRLPLDQLKIDRAFVKDILVDVASGAIAQTVISLGRALGLLVIAEGVETKDQQSFLIHLGCTAFQGYLFSRPLPVEEFHRLAGFTVRRPRRHRPVPVPSAPRRPRRETQPA